MPTQSGRHAATGRPIGPLAPAANAQRFTDPAKTEKWFRRNCNDVLGRECSAAGVMQSMGTAAPPEDRITRSAWFIRTHDEVPAAAWQRPAIRSRANCGACHPKADQGDFNEHQVRIPR